MSLLKNYAKVLNEFALNRSCQSKAGRILTLPVIWQATMPSKVSKGSSCYGEKMKAWIMR
jgi:hypothetical protein